MLVWEVSGTVHATHAAARFASTGSEITLVEGRGRGVRHSVCRTFCNLCSSNTCTSGVVGSYPNPQLISDRETPRKICSMQ